MVVGGIRHTWVGKWCSGHAGCCPLCGKTSLLRMVVKVGIEPVVMIHKTLLDSIILSVYYGEGGLGFNRFYV